MRSKRSLRCDGVAKKQGLIGALTDDEATAFAICPRLRDLCCSAAGRLPSSSDWQLDAAAPSSLATAGLGHSRRHSDSSCPRPSALDRPPCHLCHGPCLLSSGLCSCLCRPCLCACRPAGQPVGGLKTEHEPDRLHPAESLHSASLDLKLLQDRTPGDELPDRRPGHGDDWRPELDPLELRPPPSSEPLESQSVSARDERPRASEDSGWHAERMLPELDGSSTGSDSARCSHLETERARRPLLPPLLADHAADLELRDDWHGHLERRLHDRGRLPISCHR